MAEQMLPKSSWGPGPWQDEPDELQWRDEKTGLACRIRRQMMFGQLNGYVGVPPGHALYGWDYDDEVRVRKEFLDGVIGKDIGVIDAFAYLLSDKNETAPLGLILHAHGGITFSQPGDDGLWWFGFDCGHAFDFSPGQYAMMKTYLPSSALGHLRESQTYRTIEYVKTEVTRLAFILRQLEAEVGLTQAVLIKGK